MKKTGETKKHNTALVALTAAAMLLPGISKKTEADPLDQKTAFDYKHSSYQEGDLPADKLAEDGSAKRYTIDVNQFKFKTPLSSDTEVTVSGVQEAMSGASPWYIQPGNDGKLLQVMSGATINEKRQAMDVDFHVVNDKVDTRFALGYSKENDYRSFSAGFSSDVRFNQNLTTIDYGINASQDYINAVASDIYRTRPTEKTKTHIGLLLGFSQVITKNTLVGVSSSFAYYDGYLSDPYKLALVQGLTVQDSRPSTNKQYATTIMLRQYVPVVNAAIHLDYRQYSNDWQLNSHTIEFAWYQNLGNGWQVIPSARYYQQTKAAFYQPYYDVRRADGFYSCDYRLSQFSASSNQFKLLKIFDHYSLDFAYEKYQASGDNPSMIQYRLLSVGLGTTF